MSSRTACALTFFLNALYVLAIQDDPEGMGDVLEDVMDRLEEEADMQDQGNVCSSGLSMTFG